MGGHGSRVCLSSDGKGFFISRARLSTRGRDVVKGTQTPDGARPRMPANLAFLHLPPPFYLLLRPDWFSSNIDLCFRCRCNTYPLQTASLSAPSFLCHLPAVTAAFTSPVCSNTSLCMKDIPTSPLLRQCRFPGATLSPPYACK